MCKFLRKIFVLIAINFAVLGLIFDNPFSSSHWSGAKAEETTLNPIMLITELFRNRTGKVVYEHMKQTDLNGESVEIPETEEMAKNNDAKIVLVVGDKLATGLHIGLKSAFADTPSIRVEGFGFENFGLTQSLEPTWITLLKDEIKKIKPDLVVLMLGTRDRRNIEETSSRIKFNTQAWENNYRFKVAQIASEILKLDRSLIWVGLAPTDSESRSNDFKKFNAIYKSETNVVGGQYLDIWYHFLGENGKYESIGTNFFGMKSLLRGSQGIYFTKDGYRKLAYFVERETLNTIGNAQSDIERNDTGNPNYLLLTGINPSQIGTTNSKLPRATLYRNSLQYRFMVLGESLPRVEGRIDDYVWSPSN